MIFDFFIRKVRAIYARMDEKLACNDINCIFYVAFELCNSAKDYQFANGIYNFPQIRLYMLRPPNHKFWIFKSCTILYTDYICTI